MRHRKGEISTGAIAMVVRFMVGEDDMQVAMLTERGVMGRERARVCGCADVFRTVVLSIRT